MCYLFVAGYLEHIRDIVPELVKKKEGTEQQAARALELGRLDFIAHGY